jgi:ParB-like chromosome segregation protein Spo0J
MPLEAHRFASMFPALDDGAFRELVEDIRVNGLREPITRFEGKILDGVNRYRACLETGIEPLLKDYEGTDPLGFVISMNLRRRHLNETQRAMVAAKIATMSQGARTDLSPIDERSQEDAATLLNVSKRSVERAAKVLNRGALELVDKVQRGEVSVAAAVADLPEAEQRAVVNQGKKVVAQAAKAARVRCMLAGGPMQPKQVKSLVGLLRQESAEAEVEQIVPPPGSTPDLVDLNEVGQPSFAPRDVLAELDKAEKLLDTIDVRGCPQSFRQPQLTTGIETCQRIRSCVDKIEAEFIANLENERAWRAADPAARSTPKEARPGSGG